jgi:tripartite-type tricarboxylate transporter receptor subunit TctC
VPCAAAAEWPQRPVRIIVGFAAGGNTGSIPPLAAEWLRARLGESGGCG